MEANIEITPLKVRERPIRKPFIKRGLCEQINSYDVISNITRESDDAILMAMVNAVSSTSREELAGIGTALKVAHQSLFISKFS